MAPVRDPCGLSNAIVEEGSGGAHISNYLQDAVRNEKKKNIKKNHNGNMHNQCLLCVDTKYFTHSLARVPLYSIGGNPGVAGVFPW